MLSAATGRQPQTLAGPLAAVLTRYDELRLPDAETLARAMLSGFQGGRWIKTEFEDLQPRTQVQLLGEADAVRALLSQPACGASPDGCLK